MVWVKNDGVLVNLDKVEFLFMHESGIEFPEYQIKYSLFHSEKYTCLMRSENKEFIDNAFKQIELHLKPLVFEEEEDVD